MRILIAEDEPVHRRMLEAMMRKWGYDVVVARDGKEAWDFLRADDAPQLVVLDWVMPGLDGVEVCRLVRELKQPLRPHIIILTGKEGKQDLITGINAGADDYLTKPFEAEELRVRIRAGERILTMQAEMFAAKETLRFQATHDALTGLLNRASILERLQKELARAARTGKTVSVVMADLDHFKRVNDTHGHAAGDVVLAEAARRMSARMRPYEDLGRFGGEEFLAVLTESDLDGAEKAAERLRSEVAGKEFDVRSAKVSVTASFGVACSSLIAQPTESVLLGMADAALYVAKQAGRNRVARGVAPSA